MEKIKKLGVSAAVMGASAGVIALPAMASAAIEYTGNLTKLAGAAKLDTGSTDLVTIIGAIVGTVLVLLGVVLIVLILYAGFLWMTSQGDKTKVDKAKQMIYQAIIGLLIVFAAYAITNFVFGALTSVTGGNVYGG